LIIYGKESESALKQLQTSFGKEKIGVVSIQNANDAILFQSHLKSALYSGDVVLIDIKSDLHPTVIEMLKSFGEKNSYKDLDISIDMSRPIICTASKEIIEATISYPYFYNLFGPVYHLD
jgi:TATA-binding protein-associated factor Taf7